MSTGLTYVSVSDYALGNPQSASWCVVFNDYSEAYSFADWQSRFSAAGENIYVMIWTASPNQNGYFLTGSFTPFD